MVERYEPINKSSIKWGSFGRHFVASAANEWADAEFTMEELVSAIRNMPLLDKEEVVRMIKEID